MAKFINILLLIIMSLNCCAIKQKDSTQYSYSLLLEKNKKLLIDYFTENAYPQNRYSHFNARRSYWINSMAYEELCSDTLIIYETLFSNVSSNYNCVIFNSTSKLFKYYTELSQLKLSENFITLHESPETPPGLYVCLINKVREKGVYNWKIKESILTGNTELRLLTIAIKGDDKLFKLNAYKGVAPPIDCK